MNGTQTGSSVVNGFAFSQEFTGRETSTEEFVTILYRALFGREPDPRGYAVWVNYLSGGASRQDVLEGFIHSQEFENLSNGYGIVPYSS